MKIAIIGRTEWLIAVAEALVVASHEIAVVITSRAESYYAANDNDFAVFATRVGAKFVMGDGMAESDLGLILQNSGAEVGVSINWPRIMGKAMTEVLPYGILNSHSGDLPRYRGNACPNWAILAGEPSVAMCVHRMVPEEIDSGPILARVTMPITAQTYITDICAWTATKLPGLWVEALANMANPGFTPHPQSGALPPLRSYPRRPVDALINWQAHPEMVLRLIRASSRPFGGAFSFINGGARVTVWRACSSTLPYEILAVPGQILGKGNVGPLVACGPEGNNVIELEEIEVADDCRFPTHSGIRLHPPIPDWLTGAVQ